MINEHCSGAKLFEQVMWPVNIQVGREGVTYELILNPITRALGEIPKASIWYRRSGASGVTT